MEENSLSMGLFQKLFSGEEAHDLVIRNIAIVNPAVSGEPAVGDIFIHDGKIAAETEVAAGAGEIDGTPSPVWSTCMCTSVTRARPKRKI